MTADEPHGARARSWMLAAALCAALAGTLLHLTWRPRDGASAEAVAGRRADARASSELAAALTPPSGESTRFPLEAAFIPAQSASRPASFDTVPLDTVPPDALRGRVIDAHRAPIAGARVSVERRELPAGFTLAARQGSVAHAWFNFTPEGVFETVALNVPPALAGMALYLQGLTLDPATLGARTTNRVRVQLF